MSRSQGLNFNAIQQNLQAAGEEGTVTTKFATQNYVDSQIQRNFNPVPNVNFDVTLNGATSVSISGGSNETVVTFGLSTTLGNIKDVNLKTIPPANGQYLKYDGANWIAGNGASVFSITNLTDFDPGIDSDGLTPNAFLRVNSQGSSIVMDTTNVVSKIIPNSGILVENDNTEYFIESDVSNLTRAYIEDDSPNNSFAMAVNNSTDTRRMVKSDISLDGFDKGNFMKDTDIFTSVTSGSSNILNWTSGTNGNGSGTLTLDMSTILTTGGSGNVLPISQGGTGACTAVDARTNLGVSLNSDVISYSYGQFENTLTGDVIKLVGNIKKVNIIDGGTCYTDGTDVTMNLIGYDPLTVKAKISGGAVTEITDHSGLFPYITNNLPSVKLQKSGTTGPSSAIINIELDHSYLNFGLPISSSTSGLSGCGLRFDPGTCTIEFKEGLGTCFAWKPFTNIFGVSELKGVCRTSFEPAGLLGGELLIYNNNLWTATELSGPVNISSDGTVTLSGISPQTIDSNTPITVPEFSTLSGICTNIQEQLNDRIKSGPGIVKGDIIYYTGVSSSGSKEFDKVYKGADPYAFLFRGTSIPRFDNLYHGFKPETSLPGTSSHFCILDETSKKAKSYSLNKTVDFLSGTSGGIGSDSDGKLALDYLNLENKSSVQPTDLIATGISNSVGISPVQSITVKDFVSSIAGTGVCGSSGFLNLQVRTGASPGSLTGNFDGELAYFYNATAPGPSVLAVNYGGSWYGASVSLVS